MATTKVLDLTGRARKLQVTVESGPSFEFLVSLCAFGLPNDRETMEVGPAWFDKIRRLASPELLAAWDRTGLMAGKAWVNFVGLATATPAARDVPALLARIQSLSALDVRLYLLGYHVPAYQGKISRDLLPPPGGSEADTEPLAGLNQALKISLSRLTAVFSSPASFMKTVSSIP